MSAVEDDRDGAPDGLRRIREVEGAAFCSACESDGGRSFRVSPPGSPSVGRVLCWTCAKEVAYGIVPPGLPLRSFGGRRPGFPDEDADGFLANRTRAREEAP